MIITIDGPTGSGKTSVASSLAQKLGFCALNSGRFYRAIAYILHNVDHIPLDQFKELDAALLKSAFERFTYRYNPAKMNFDIFYTGQLINEQLKDMVIDQAASVLGTNPKAREMINDIQRAVAQEYKNVVVEGRDAGSVVFPNAELKIFLTARPEIRAERWQKDQKKRGNEISLPQALQQISERDLRDSKRDIAPLTIPDDAFVFDNSAYDKEETVTQLFDYIKTYMNV